MSVEFEWLKKATQVLTLLEQYLLTKEKSWFAALFDQAMLDCTFVINVATHTVLWNAIEARALAKQLPKNWLEQEFIDAWSGLSAMPPNYREVYPVSWSDTLACIKDLGFQKLLAAEALFRNDNHQRDHKTYTILVCVLRAEILYPKLTRKLYQLFPAKRYFTTPTGALMSYAEREINVQKAIYQLLCQSLAVDDSSFHFSHFTNTIKEKIHAKPSDSLMLLQLTQYFTWDSNQLNAYVNNASESSLASDAREITPEAPSKALCYLDPVIWSRTSFAEMLSTKQVLQYLAPFEENVRQVSHVLTMLNSLRKDQAAALVALVLKINETLDALVALLQLQDAPSYLEVVTRLAHWRHYYPGLLVRALFAFFYSKDMQQESLVELLHLTIKQQFFCSIKGVAGIEQRVAALLEQSLAAFFNERTQPPCSPVLLKATALSQVPLPHSVLTLSITRPSFYQADAFHV